MLTTEILKKICPFASSAKLQVYAPLLNQFMVEFEINTLLRVRHFIAQAAHESGSFNFNKENLNYKAEGLLKTFPKYFKTLEEAISYQYSPEKIANRVYGGRMGNKPEINSDKSKSNAFSYIGRGIFQCTGFDNYKALSLALFNDLRLLDKPEILEQPEYSVKSACWFWKSRNLNLLADKDDLISITKRINGATNGLADRQNFYTLAKKYII